MAIEETALSDEERAQFAAIKNEQEVKEGEVEVKEEVKEEPKEESKPEVKEEKKESFVPHGAFHEEREKRKALQRELTEMREKFARVDERLQILTTPKQVDKGPDPNEDPLAYQSWRAEKIERELQEARRTVGEDSKKLQNELEGIKFRQFIDQQERLFERDTPDYQEAMNHFVGAKTAALDELGVESDEREALIRQELSTLVQKAIEKGKNPAKAIYDMAGKLGYKRKEPEKKLEQIEKGVKASSSLGSTGGKQATSLTAEALAEMSEEEFAALSYADIKKVMGG